MRSFLISMPADSAPKNVLIFLHGVGEAFIPIADAQQLYSPDASQEVLTKPGVSNLFNHGIPMILGSPGKYSPRQLKNPKRTPFSLPLFNDFLVIIPQMYLREDMADLHAIDDMMNHACAFARSVVGDKGRIALIGFSRGGYAAFHLAQREEVKALVTMDAAPRKDDMPRFIQTVQQQRKPYWAFYADYKQHDEDFEKRITNVHRNEFKVPEINLSQAAPHENQCKTLVPTKGLKGDKHNQVCDIVSASPAVYEWVRNRL